MRDKLEVDSFYYFLNLLNCFLLALHGSPVGEEKNEPSQEERVSFNRLVSRMSDHELLFTFPLC